VYPHYLFTGNGDFFLELLTNDSIKYIIDSINKKILIHPIKTMKGIRYNLLVSES